MQYGWDWLRCLCKRIKKFRWVRLSPDDRFNVRHRKWTGHAGDDLPPDEINIIEEGKNYGWPDLLWKEYHDTDYDRNVYIRNPCMEPFEMLSLVDLQAHSAPLGLAFYSGDSFPQEYRVIFSLLIMFMEQEGGDRI